MNRLIPTDTLPLFKKHGKYPERSRVGGINSDSCCGIGITLIELNLNPRPKYPLADPDGRNKMWPIPGVSAMYLQGYWRGFDCFGLMDQFRDHTYHIDGWRKHSRKRTDRAKGFRQSPDFLQGMKDGRDLLELCRIEFPEWWPTL
jgi:hypothetical protein